MRRRGFTLVELLVVIGIIAVLISILLPVLTRVRDQANAAVCASNERQIYHALLLYAQANRDWLPVPGSFSLPVFPNQVIVQLDFGAYDYTAGVLWPYVSRDVAVRERLFLCPADGPDRTVVMDPSDSFQADPARQRNFSYNFNGLLQGYRSGTVMTDRGPLTGWTGMRLSRILHSSNKLLVLESRFPRDSAQETVTYAYNGPFSLLGNRHGGLANQCFVDGHVERFDPALMNDQATSKHYTQLETSMSGYVP